MAHEHKEMSEHESLLSDDMSDVGSMPVIKMDQINEDPLVAAAMQKHNEIEIDNVLNDIQLELNTFCIPESNQRISAGISFEFLDSNKVIELDLIVTALDMHSIEMDTISKDNKKMLKKSVYHKSKSKNKNKDDDKLINVKLDLVPPNCHSLWCIINACNGDSLKDVDKAIFSIYENENGNENGNHKLYSYDIDMGFDSGAMLLGVLVRSAQNKNQFIWTAIEEKNLYSHLIPNNLQIFYENEVIEKRPNDKNVKCELKANDSYIIDKNIPKLQIGIGWRYTANDGNNDVMNDNDKKLINEYDIDIDIDASIVLFGQYIQSENESGVNEETIDEIDIVNNNNKFYKTYVQYCTQSMNHKMIEFDNDINNDKNEELGVINNNAAPNIEDYIDEEIFDVYMHKMRCDNDIGAVCVLLNILNDNNVKNQSKTNNIKDCYVRLMDVDNDGKELCRYQLSAMNEDKKTCAFVLGYMRKLDNECWALSTNDVPYKANSSLDYKQYAREIVLGKFKEKSNENKDACCVIL